MAYVPASGVSRSREPPPVPEPIWRIALHVPGAQKKLQPLALFAKSQTAVNGTCYCFFLSKLQNTLPKYAATLSTNSSYDFQVPWGTIRQKKRWNKLQLQYVFGVSNPFALRCLCGNPIQQKQAPQQDGDPAPPPSLPENFKKKLIIRCL